jgi:ribonuclease D
VSEAGNELKKSISKEELSELEMGHFNGDIHIVDSEEQITVATDYLANHSILGFDTETRPSFKKGQTNKVALLQLSTPDKAFLFRINSIGLPQELVNLLASDSIEKVGVAIHDDIKILQDVNHFQPNGFVELQEYVKEFGIENFGLKKLAGLLLGFRISKAQRLSNWEAEELTPSQQRYAATDAWVSLKIYDKLLQTAEQK